MAQAKQEHEPQNVVMRSAPSNTLFPQQSQTLGVRPPATQTWYEAQRPPYGYEQAHSQFPMYQAPAPAYQYQVYPQTQAYVRPNNGVGQYNHTAMVAPASSNGSQGMLASGNYIDIPRMPEATNFMVVNDPSQASGPTAPAMTPAMAPGVATPSERSITPNRERQTNASTSSPGEKPEKQAISSVARKMHVHSQERRVCSREGCSNVSLSRNLCLKHGGFRMCSIPGCAKRAQCKGLCRRHGPKEKCKAEDCKLRAIARGLCYKHCGYWSAQLSKEVCTIEDCERPMVAKGLCYRHCGYGQCKAENCTKRRLHSGFCSEHAALLCDRVGCSEDAVAHGLCSIHAPASSKAVESTSQ